MSEEQHAEQVAQMQHQSYMSWWMDAHNEQDPQVQAARDAYEAASAQVRDEGGNQ